MSEKLKPINVMKTELSKIAQELEQGNITETEAQDLLLGLLGVIGSFTLDDMRKAFIGGRDSIEAELKCERYGDMEFYASKKIVKSFKTFIHENYR